jgi:glycosyltransferase involved in cell wall biosynthesis
MLAATISRKYHIPYVITEHSTFYATGSPDQKLLRRVKEAHRYAAALFAVSQPFAEFLNQQFGTNRFCYLPNVIDPLLETASLRDQNEKKGGFRFLNLALFKPVKDQETLLRAFAIIAKKNADVELRIGGKGDLQNKLIKLVEELGVDKRVTFLGELNREAVVDELHNCNCFVLSSKYETFGVVLIEAMLFGKPVISTAVGVAPEIINEKTGFVVNVGDENALAKAMINVTEQASVYEADCIRHFAVSNFGKDAFIERINKIYREVV